MRGLSSIQTGMILAALVVLPACSRERAATVESPPVVLCTNLPLYLLTSEIVGETTPIQVELLLDPAAGCLHDHSLSIHERKRLTRAGLVIAVGLGLEPFLDAFQAGTEVRIVEVGSACELIEVGQEHDPAASDTHAGDTPHTGYEMHLYNPHVWMSPAQTGRLVKKTAAELTLQFPEFQAEFQANSRDLRQRLNELSDRMTTAGRRLRSRRVVADGGLFDYLAADLGLEVVVTLDVHEQGFMSAARLAEWVRRIRAARPDAILVPTGQTNRLSEVISRETDVKLVELDSLTMIAELPPAPGWLLRRMTYNFETLEHALGNE